MRNAIIGTVAGLLVGSLGAIGYTQFFGDGSRLADLQAQLADANAKLAKAQAESKQYKAEALDEGAQVDQLNSTKDQLSKQLTDKGITPATAPETPGLQVDPDMIRGFMAMMGGRGGPGGFRSPEQRMLVLQARLKLTSDQTDKLKAAMQADQQARRDIMRQARENGTPPDPQALAAANTFDNTLKSMLTQGQQQEYQALQNDEKTARAESSATQQVDSMMPLLQMTDDQKEKVMNALYQQQLSAPDPQGMANNPNPAGFMQQMKQQGQAMQKAMQSVLTPDQYALYQQSDQLQQQLIASRMNRGNNNGGNGNGGGNNPGGNNPPAATPMASSQSPTATPATNAPAATLSTSTTGTDTTSSATNAASATTNAVSATPPPPPGN